MSATNPLETALLALIFTNVSTGLNIGDATGLRGSSAVGNLYMSLHVADPGESGAQTTSETGYSGYTRVAKQRDTTRWGVSSNVVQNSEEIEFPPCGATGASVTHFGVGSSPTTAGNLYFKGLSSLSVSTGVIPKFTTNALQISFD